MQQGAPLRLLRMEMQVDQHLWSVMLRSIVMVTYLIVGEMRKEGLLAGTVIIVGRILYSVILHAVALRDAKMLCTIYRTW